MKITALTVIACNVLEAEVRHYARDLPQVRELVFMPQGLHNEPVRLQRFRISRFTETPPASTTGKEKP